MLTYTLTELPLPSGVGVDSSDAAEDVNADGVATGYVFDTAHLEAAFEAAIWPDGTNPEILDAPPTETIGYAINDPGECCRPFRPHLPGSCISLSPCDGPSRGSGAAVRRAGELRDRHQQQRCYHRFGRRDRHAAAAHLRLE